MNNELLLISGEDIPFIEAQISIHQPRMKELALIGEENFFAGCQLLNFSKEELISEDKSYLADRSDFEILMSIINDKEVEYKNAVMMLLALLFPECNIKITPREILLADKEKVTRIYSENYDSFKDIINSMFILNELLSASKDYNPADKRAEKIAEKFKKRKEKASASKEQKLSVFSRYISILSVGLSKDMNSFKDYTVFQLMDEFKRYQKKLSFDYCIQAKMAGAQDVEEVDNWMDNIH